MINGNEKNFDELISKGNVLVDFYATWCGPCKMLAPELEAISDKVNIVKIDVDENENLCKRFGIISVPTLIYFKTKDDYIKNSGYMPKENILSWLNKS